MNKKHIKSLGLFLTLIFIMITISAVSAVENNDATDTATTTITQDTVAETNIVSEKTNNYESNSNGINEQDIETKSIDKKNQTSEDTKGCFSSISMSNKDSIDIGSKIAIYGRVSANGTNIAQAPVTVKVDGETYNLTTSKYGYFKVILKPTTTGIKPVVATYEGSDDYFGSIGLSSFIVTKKSTELMLKSTKTSYIGKTIKIEGKLLSNDKALAKQNVTVYVDLKPYNLTTTKDGNYYLNVTANKTGYHLITATYAGTDIYAANANLTYFNVTKKSTQLQLNNTETAYVGGKIYIKGKLTVNGKALANQNITVYVNGKQYNITTSKYGKYLFKVNADKAGYYLVTATYAGTDLYAASANLTYYTVNKKPTQITLNTTKTATVGGKIYIKGKLRVNGKVLANQNVTVYVDLQKFTFTTTKYGNYHFSIDADKVGYHLVTATYAGTDAYDACANLTYFQIKRKS